MVSVLYVTGWESDASCQDQLQSGIEQNQSNLDYFQQIVLKITLRLCFEKLTVLTICFAKGMFSSSSADSVFQHNALCVQHGDYDERES